MVHRRAPESCRDESPAPVISKGRLFVSFWDLCLENLPEGGFVRRRVAPGEARALIAQAREAQRLLCVSETDLMAPYHERERDNHAQLRRALEDQYEIVLSLEDFCDKSEEDGEDLYFINPLSCAQVQGADRLMIVTCAYAFAEGRVAGADLRFEIAPDSIAFHLIEATG
jgi:hypothetical protein